MSEFLQLAGKTIIVTGASSGIGRAVAVAASRHGATIALVSRTQDALEETRSMMSGENHICVATDLSNTEGIEAVVKGAAVSLRGIDGVVHAAGAHATAPLKSVTSADAQALLNLNVTSAIMVARAYRHKQVRRGTGSLVLLSSAVGSVGQPGVSVYSATKGAILSLTKSLALELARDSIRVNCVAPGVVLTPMTEKLRQSIGAEAFAHVERAHPLGLGQPDDVAAAVLFLLSPASRWITGSSIAVDGGYTAQ